MTSGLMAQRSPWALAAPWPSGISGPRSEARLQHPFRAQGPEVQEPNASESWSRGFQFAPLG